MKRKLLRATAIGLGICAIGFMALTPTAQRQYVPRANAGQSFEAAGATAYLHKLRANQLTGEISQADVMAANNQLNLFASANKASALGLNWASKGPDNQGGRTRAFIIDRNSNNVLYVAGVAGGIFKSSNAGLSWVSASEDLNNMAVVSLAQAPNGDMYAGTGEGMYAPTSGIGSATSPGMTGSGMYKSTDNGVTWTALSTTVPPANNASSAWSSIGAIVVDPVNSNRIYSGTGGGLRRSDDAGASWTNPIGQGGVCTDMAIATDGSVWINLAGRTFFSSNGDDNNWAEVSKSVVGSSDLPRGNGRVKYAISAQDPNTVYAVVLAGNALSGIYRTYDKGSTWTLIQAKTTLFDPMCNTNSGQCQGGWDLLLGVSPSNKDQIFLGGITIWEWKKVGGWRQVDSQVIPIFDVHSDKHTITWDPVNTNIIYVTTDGGVHKSSDGGYTWQDMNKNYTTTQFYQSSIGQDRKIIGGTQDNGSWVITGEGNTPNQGTQLGAVDGFRGDGGFSLISWLNDDQYFTEYQSGRMGRSENRGQSFSSFWDPRMLANGSPGSGGFSGWILPYYLHETTTDPLSEDSVFFKAYPSSKSEGFGNGATKFINTLTKAQTSGQFVTTSFKVKSGSLVISSDAQGVLSGNGTGTFDPATGQYDVTFTTVPLAEIVITCDVTYPTGSVVEVGSNINSLPFKHTLTSALLPNDSIEIQDQVQSIVVAGLNGSVWMTRMAHNWSEPTKWWKIASMGGTAQSVTMSADGNYAWVGTEGGSVVRMSNLSMARNDSTADIDAGAADLKVEYSIVRTFSGRSVTNIAVDPNNPDRVAVTLGNYGNNAYVYVSTNATAANPTFESKQGNLPNFPVYSVTFNKANAANLIIGTEYGIFSTDNINAGSPSWTEENNGMPRTPVFALTQYRTGKSSTSSTATIYEGDIFAGTHGRGLFWSNDLQTARPVGVEENKPFNFAQSSKQLEMFPNPAIDFTTLSINLSKSSDVNIFVRDINGRLVKQIKLSKMQSGEQELRINTSDLASGTYVLTLQQGNDIKSGKFVVSK